MEKDPELLGGVLKIDKIKNQTIKNIVNNNIKYTNTKTILSSKSDSDLSVIDADWISSRFMTPNNKMQGGYGSYRFNSTATRKFTDTSIGGNVGINTRPQFTRYADIRPPQRTLRQGVDLSSQGNHGMGRYYSEAIDDNQQTVFLTFGLPKFNGLIDFFTKAIDYEDSVLANTGRSAGGYGVGQTLGNLGMLAAFPMITITVWTLKLLSKLAFLGHENFSYYYLEPNMQLYWSTVNTITTNIATELGILIPAFMEQSGKDGAIGIPVKIDGEDMDYFRKHWPNIISKNNYIDVFAIATKAQATANQQMITEYERFKTGQYPGSETTGFIGSVDKNGNPDGYGKMMQSQIANDPKDNWTRLDYWTSFQVHLDNIKATGLFAEKQGDPTTRTFDTKPKTTEESDSGTQEIQDVTNKKNSDGTSPGAPSQKDGWLEKYVKATDAAVRDGGQFAIFAVDYTGSVSESFSNSTGEIQTGGLLKQVGGKARDVKFNLAGGNVTETIGAIAGTVKDVAAGILDSVSFGLSSVISTLTGGGYIDLPQKWEDSDTSFPSITYSMQLISPYGNTISQLQNIYIPLAMLLAGSLPLATGKASYTSPFICSLYSKGIQKIKLGMITSLSVTRGTSNLGFDKKRRALAIDVSFTVKDFSSLVAAPVQTSIFSNFSISLEDDTPLSQYIATIASRDLITDKYYMNRIKMKASRVLMDVDKMISPSAWGLRTGEALSFVLGGLAAEHSLTLKDKN